MCLKRRASNGFVYHVVELTALANGESLEFRAEELVNIDFELDLRWTQAAGAGAGALSVAPLDRNERSILVPVSPDTDIAFGAIVAGENKHTVPFTGGCRGFRVSSTLDQPTGVIHATIRETPAPVKVK